MKAPKKIYIQRYSYGALIAGYSDKPKEMADGENIEYIRKDALLEWLIKERDRFGKGGVNILVLNRTAFQKVIDKVNSL